MTKELPVYICHKRVRALEIAAVANIEGTVQFSFKEEGHEPLCVVGYDPIIRRYMPVAGDFYVVYEDGYQSFSPRKAFLEGHTSAGEQNALMEQLSSLAQVPDHGTVNISREEAARIAREAYVTIKSLKSQLENIERAKANDLQA